MTRVGKLVKQTMERFEFATASRILFGAGTLKQAGTIAAAWGQRALVVSGLPEKGCKPLFEVLESSQIRSMLFLAEGEPTIATIEQGVAAARREGCDLVISIGGGSAIDNGKAVAALLANPGEIYDYLEVIGQGKSLDEPSLPHLAIPTTAGTGAEVTRNAVIGVPERRVKVSLRSATMLPRVALVDPELTYSLPLEITANTGLDALTQLIEPYVSLWANPFTDILCQEGIRRVARSLNKAVHEGNNPEARLDMSLASLLGGMALANAKLGAVHGFAGPIGGMFPAPHGAVCARLLPIVMEVNLRAARARLPGSDVPARYQQIATWLTGSETAEAEDGVRWVADLVQELGIRPLGEFGLRRKDLAEVVQKSAQASSMKGNPLPLLEEEMWEILEQAL